MKTIQIEQTFQKENWFRHWFDTSFYHKLYANRSPEEAAAFIDRLLQKLCPLPGATMLDLGCGSGRHSIHLASKGYSVTGIDLASSSIREARKRESANLRFIRQDMRKPFGHQQFDYVFSFFTSFGYFSSPEDDDSVISNITQSLKPGGQIMLDYINIFRSEKNLVASECREIDGIIYRIERWTDEQFFYKKIRIDQSFSGGPAAFTEQVRKLSLPDFKELLARQGLTIQQVYGNYRLDSFQAETSPRLIMIAG